MKKLISLIALLAILLNCFSVLILAADVSPHKDASTAEYDGIGKIDSCFYDGKKESVYINGSITHDTMVTHNGYKIAVYRVENGQTLKDAINIPGAKPVANTNISIKFQFDISAKDNSKRFARYAVVLHNEDGDIVPLGDPIYPAVLSEYSFNLGSKLGYKGISSSLTSSAIASGVSTAIIPVNFDELLSKTSSGYMYFLQGSYIYFNKEYIDTLDKKIRSLDATGCRVYLQFLIKSDSSCGVVLLESDDTAEYGVPDMSSSQSVNVIAAFSDFLCERYSSAEHGTISGIILGRYSDLLYSNSRGRTVENYAENFAKYLIVVSNIARSLIPSADIVIPFSDRNSYTVDSLSSFESKCPPSALLDGICAFIDDSFLSKLAFSTLIESDSIPFGISDDTLKTKSFSTDSYMGINADNTDIYSEYIKLLKASRRNAPDNFIFLWTVPHGISGNVLSCAYSYSYFKLMANKNISSFVVSFESSESKNDFSVFPQISHCVKYIDTTDSFDVTAPQLKLLGHNNWYSVIDKMYDGDFNLRKIINPTRIYGTPSNVIGTYVYHDFSYYTSLSSWFGGSFCNSMKIDYNKISGRSLIFHFNQDRALPSEYSEIYCSYDYPENFAFTPYMELNFSIMNDNESEHALYEVFVSFGKDKVVSELTSICRSYENVTMLFDLSEFNDLSMADYIRIGIRCLSGDNGGYSLCLSSMKGYSDKYLSDELDTLIYEERLRIRETHDTSGGGSIGTMNTIMIVAGVAIVIALIGIGVFMCFKKDD